MKGRSLVALSGQQRSRQRLHNEMKRIYIYSQQPLRTRMASAKDRGSCSDPVARVLICRSSPRHSEGRPTRSRSLYGGSRGAKVGRDLSTCQAYKKVAPSGDSRRLKACLTRLSRVMYCCRRRLVRRQATERWTS